MIRGLHGTDFSDSARPKEKLKFWPRPCPVNFRPDLLGLSNFKAGSFSCLNIINISFCCCTCWWWWWLIFLQFIKPSDSVLTAFRYSVLYYISGKYKKWNTKSDDILFKNAFNLNIHIQSLSQTISISPNYEKNKLNENLEMHSIIIKSQ